MQTAPTNMTNEKEFGVQQVPENSLRTGIKLGLYRRPDVEDQLWYH